jgi:hypothetical protein
MQGMSSNISVAALGKELGVSINGVFRMAHTVGINVTRGGALLTPTQADKIREHSRRLLERQVRAAAVPPPLRPAVRPTTAQSTARAPLPPPTVGPTRACACCGLNLGGTRPQLNEEVEPERCAICMTHYAFLGEEDSRRVSRLEDHDTRLRRAYAVTWTQEQKAEDRANAGYRSRDSWRGAFVEVMDLHEEVGTGGCGCGAKTFPCATWKALERANKGILHQVEEFLALTDEERDRRLYGRDHWDHDVA